MKNEKIDLEKVKADMDALMEKRVNEITEFNSRKGIETDQETLRSQITIKYLYKMQLTNEMGELVDKDIYISIEQVNGQFQIRYYDEDQNMLGRQLTIDGNIMPSEELAESLTEGTPEKEKEEAERILRELEEKDKTKAKTFEELQAEQEPQQLPGLEGPQLTREQVDKLTGPKVNLIDSVIDGETLRNVIGLEGVQMQLIDSDAARKLMPDLEIPAGQRTVPIEIFPDGSANAIGEDKLQFSRIEGTNSTDQHVTTTNEGTIRSEQNIETLNITNKADMHTIAIGYDGENGLTSIKCGRRNPENPSEIAYTELEKVHEGPLQQADETRQAQKSQEDGIYKGQEAIEDAVETYAKAMNIREIDAHGYPTSEYDLEAARLELEARWAENPDLTLKELIDEGQKQQGPAEGPRSHY